MHESIFRAIIRSFFKTMFAVIGIGFGLLFITALLVGLSQSTEAEPEITYNCTPEIVSKGNFVRKETSRDTPIILKIDISGIIGTELLNRQTVEQQLIESRERYFKDNQVKALLLVIDTPGGTVTDADGIYRSIKAYKEHFKVPVFAHVNGFCASGGMYVASSADKIYATESSLIGSIGVLSPSFLNFSQLMEKIGIQALTLYAGKGKDDLDPLRPWKPGEQDALQAIIHYYYQLFVDIVVAARPGVDKDKLINEYGAKVFPAKLAKEYGFIDESNYSLDQTIHLLVKEAGINDDNFAVVKLKSTDWLSTLLTSRFGLLKGKITHKVSLSPELEPEIMNQFLYMHRFEH